MTFGKLYKQELKVAYDIKYFTFLIFIFLLAIGMPFYGISGYISSQILTDGVPVEIKNQVLRSIENLLLSRFTLTMLIFASWSVFPRLFYGGKESGEVEAKLSIGYSAKKIWLSKALAVITAATAISIPLTLAIYGFMRTYFVKVFEMNIKTNLFSWIQGFVLNPILVFGVVLMAGGFQLLADDVRLSSLAVMLLGFVNVGSMLGVKENIDMEKTISDYMLIYAVAVFVLVILNLLISKWMHSENVVISSLNLKMKKERFSRDV